MCLRKWSGRMRLACFGDSPLMLRVILCVKDVNTMDPKSVMDLVQEARKQIENLSPEQVQEALSTV